MLLVTVPSVSVSVFFIFFGPGGEYVGLCQAREMHGQRHRQGIQVVGSLAHLVYDQGEGLGLVAGFGVAAQDSNLDKGRVPGGDMAVDGRLALINACAEWAWREFVGLDGGGLGRCPPWRWCCRRCGRR